MADLTDSLSHSLTIHIVHMNNCPIAVFIYIQAAKTILEEFDSLTGISPMQELSGVYVYCLMN